MEALERCLEELYSPATRPERLHDIQRDLLRIQTSFSMADLHFCLELSSPLVLIFAFQSVASRSEDFFGAETALLKWYSSYSGDIRVIKYGATALAALLVAHPLLPSELFENLPYFLQAHPLKGFILLETLATEISRRIKLDIKELARLLPIKTALAELVHMFLHQINERNIEFAISALKEIAPISSNAQFDSIVHALFSFDDIDLKLGSLLVDFLNTCSEKMHLRKLIPWYLTLFSREVIFWAHLTSVLAAFQDKMDEFCSLTERLEVCNLVLDGLVSSKAFNIGLIAGFWEELADDLSSSDLVGEADKRVFKRLVDILLWCECDNDSFRSLIEAAYKVIGNDLVDDLVHSYSMTRNIRCLEGLVSVGDQYVGPIDPIKVLIDSIFQTDNTLFLHMFRAYYHTLKRDSECCAKVCELLCEYFCANNDHSLLAADCLALYSSFVNERSIMLLTQALVNCPEMSSAKLFADTCSKACTNREVEFSARIIETISSSCCRDLSLQILPIFLANDSFEFLPRKCPSFCNLVYLSALDMSSTTIEEREIKSNLSFLSSVVSRVALIDREFCSSILRCLCQNVSANIISIFAAAESVAHYPESLTIINFFSEMDSFNEDLINLDAEICRSNIDSYMEIGYGNVLKSLESCMKQMAQPLSFQELKSILNLYSALFFEGHGEPDINWRRFVLKNTIASLMDILLSSSNRFADEMIEFVASFVFRLATIQTELFKEYVTHSNLRSSISWMLRERSMKQFTNSYRKLFK